MPCLSYCMYVGLIYGRKKGIFLIVLQTVLQYFVVKLQCVLCKITSPTVQNYKSTNPSTKLATQNYISCNVRTIICDLGL